MAKTIYDIAKAAEVSIATVSRVFNRSGTVKETTRKKVLNIADEMGYHPQAYAQGLASKKKNNIMMLVPVMSNYFFTEILKGTQDILSDENFELNIVNINQEKGAFKQVEQILKRQWADGYLFVSLHFDDKNLKKLKRYNVPVSLLDDYSTHFDSVAFDNEKGAHMATKYLLKKGHQRIAFISGRSDAIPVLQRMKGYKSALSEKNIKFDDELVVLGDTMERDGFTEKSGYEAMQKLLNSEIDVDACFCTSDIKAIGAQKAMREHNKFFPLVSYDNLTISEYVELTTIHQPIYDMGYNATELLLKRIERPDVDISNVVLSPKLIIRSSSEV